MGNWFLRKKSHVVERFLVESHLSARLTLSKLGVPRATFYYWYGSEPGLQDQYPMPKHVWNCIPDKLRRQVVKPALEETELSS